MIFIRGDMNYFNTFILIHFFKRKKLTDQVSQKNWLKSPIISFIHSIFFEWYFLSHESMKSVFLNEIIKLQKRVIYILALLWKEEYILVARLIESKRYEEDIFNTRKIVWENFSCNKGRIGWLYFFAITLLVVSF